MYSEEHEDPLYTKLSKILELTSLIFGHYKDTGQKERAHSLIVWVVSALQAVIENRQKLYVSLRLHVQNVVPAQPCVGKIQISLVLLNFLHCNFRLWFETP